MQVNLVSKTQVDSSFNIDGLDLSNPEALMIWIARVSSSKQNNPKYAKLLKYCIENGHWSVFEMIDVTFEIYTSRAIAQQILRHRSFSFQEFSQRYAEVADFEEYSARRQASNNRQSSQDTLSEDDQEWFIHAQRTVQTMATQIYQAALEKGIGRECARFLLPLGTQTRMFMKGSLRSWIHYLKVRDDEHTQLEHREIAQAIKEILKHHFPTIAEAMEW
jgi:thymidylate synthase (FAD)